MSRGDADCLEAIDRDKHPPESCRAALRAAGCGELADDWRLCITLAWIAASEATTFEGLNHSMGGTLRIASGFIRKLVND